MKRFLLLASLAVIETLTAQAQVVFTDSFESYTPGTNSTSFSPWTVTAGSVDILNVGTFPTLPPRTGSQNLDMDGSTNAAGTITRSFAVTSGVTYTLTYYYSGNRRNSNTDSMTVTLGTASVTHTIPGTQGYTFGSLTWTATSTGTANVTFAHVGNDNIGMLLDDVTVSVGTLAVPTLTEWGMMGLTAMLILFGSLKAQRVNA